jgi:hypothetical protein
MYLTYSGDNLEASRPPASAAILFQITHLHKNEYAICMIHLISRLFAPSDEGNFRVL